MVLSSVRSAVNDVTTQAILHVVEKSSEHENIRHPRYNREGLDSFSSLKEIIPRIKRLIYIGLTCFGLFWVSCYTYGMIYFFVIPPNYATVPVHFDYNRRPSHQPPHSDSCISDHKEYSMSQSCSNGQNPNMNSTSSGEECSSVSSSNNRKHSLLYESDRLEFPPSATIDLFRQHTQWHAHVPDVAPKQKSTISDIDASKKTLSKSHVLHTNQPYFIDVALTLPETDINRQLGIFMVEVDLKDNDDLLLASSSRSSMLPYESTYLSLARQTVFMIPYLLGAIPQARTVIVKCFDRYIEAEEYPLRTVEIRLIVPNLKSFPHTIRSIQVINSELRIGKELNFIQTAMKEWFYTSAFFAIIVFMFFYGCILCLIQMYLPSNHSSRDSFRQQLNRQKRGWQENYNGPVTHDFFQNSANEYDDIMGETDNEFDFYGDEFELEDADSLFYDSKSEVSKKTKNVENHTNGMEQSDDETKFLNTNNANASLNKKTEKKLEVSKKDQIDDEPKLEAYEDESNSVGVQRVMKGEIEPYEVFTGKNKGSDSILS